jgi:RNA polymerase sigma factor (TIGR02999 family)
MSDFTRLLTAIDTGDPHAAAELLPLVYAELRRLAAAQMAREKPGQTLDATALVHEAYLRLVGPADKPHWKSRRHFFAAAAEAMRRILVENARRKKSQKRGGRLRRQPLDNAETAALAPGSPGDEVLAVDEALTALAAKEPVKAELVKLRYFAGLTIDQAAKALGISTATAERYWAYAKAWLHYEIRRGDSTSQGRP